MKQAGIIIFFLAIGIVLSLAIAQTTGLTLKVSGVIAAIACILVYLMLDLRPETKPNDATIIRLMRGDWSRKK